MSSSHEDYLPIELNSITSCSMLDFDLYKESGGYFRLFRRRNVALREGDLRTLIERGCKTLFVPKDQSDSLCEHQTRHLPELLKDESVPVERKFAVLTDISLNLYEKFLVNPVPAGTVKRAVDQCENHVDLALQGERARQTMLQEKPQASSPSIHAINVCNLSILLGLEFGISDPDELRAIGVGGLLHEIGKTLIDSQYFARSESKHHIANTRLKKYPQLGAQMLSKEHATPPEAVRSVLEHQERLDGSGFPRQLQGSEIGIAARIVAICDAFDESMSHNQGLVEASAFKILMQMKSSATKFDMKLFQSFVRLLGSDVARSCCTN